MKGSVPVISRIACVSLTKAKLSIKAAPNRCSPSPRRTAHANSSRVSWMHGKRTKRLHVIARGNVFGARRQTMKGLDQHVLNTVINHEHIISRPGGQVPG